MRAPFKLFVLVLLIVLVSGVAWFGRTVEDAGKKAAAEMTGGNPDIGKVAIRNYGCSACHTIPGVPGAYANVGPSLKQVGSRSYIGGVVKNTPDNLIAWIRHPHALDAKTAMPDLHVSQTDARNIAAYLYTLQ